jgi:hypothetical protein
MNRIILVLTVTLFATSGYSQQNKQNEYDEWKPSQDEYKSFDIGKYKTPDIVRNQLDINVNFRSYNLHQDNSFLDREDKNGNDNVNGNFSAIFSRYTNTRKIISNLTGTLSIEGSYTSLKHKQTFINDNSTSTDNLSSLLQRNGLSLNWSNKWYFSKLFFMDYGISTNVSYNTTQRNAENQPADNISQTEKDFLADISPRLGIGNGRIENVRDARQAVYIANALSKKKVLTRNLSDDELFALSQIMSAVKNKRFLDSRLRLIEEITSVDSFFVNNRILAENGAAYFTTLYDMWQYGDLFERNSGYEISLVARPYYRNQKLKHTPVMQDINHNRNQHLMSLTFNYEKPFKLNWQHSLSAEVAGGINSSSERIKETDNNYKKNTDGKIFSAFAAYSLGYYPNTRTNIQVAASQQISKNIYDGEENSGNSMYSYTMISANLYYYFSPNLRLTGNYGFLYSPSRFKGNEGYYFNRNTFSSSFNIQLTYSFF